MSLSRSDQMARIRSRDTKPERALRRELWRRGVRYRLRHPVPAGRPDIILPGRRVAVFVDGCFWHGCPVHYVPPRSRCEYWDEKLKGNVTRDILQTRLLRAAQWGVIRVWECALLGESAARVADQVKRKIEGEQSETAPEWRVIQVFSLDQRGEREQRVMVDLYNLHTRCVVERARSFGRARSEQPPSTP
jgi:DNA mismatch endonuclease, patch repair protein